MIALRFLMLATLCAPLAALAQDVKPPVDPNAKPADPNAKPAAPKPEPVQESELVPLDVKRSTIFPWNDPKRVPPTPATTPPKPVTPKEDPNASAPAILDPSAGDIALMTGGEPFSREVKTQPKLGGGTEDKEVMTLNKDVEIEQASQGTVLRAQKVVITRDVASGNLDFLEATGGIELVTQDRKARGATMNYEAKYNAKGEPTKSIAIVDGDRDARKPAVVWSGETDTVRAFKFVIDTRLNTFRAVGGMVANLSMPTPDANNPATPAPTANAGPTPGALPGLSLSGGGTVTITCDGDLFFDSASGRVKIQGNVYLIQPELQMAADEVILLLAPDDPNNPATPPPANGAAPAGGGVFSGSIKSLEARGRVEIVTPSQVVHCDRLMYDLDIDRLHLEVKAPEDPVLVFFRDPNAPTELKALQRMLMKNPVEIEAKTGQLIDNREAKHVGTRNEIKTFREPIPEIRQRKFPRLKALLDELTGVKTTIPSATPAPAPQKK